MFKGRGWALGFYGVWGLAFRGLRGFRELIGRVVLMAFIGFCGLHCVGLTGFVGFTRPVGLSVFRTFRVPRESL